MVVASFTIGALSTLSRDSSSSISVLANCPTLSSTESTFSIEYSWPIALLIAERVANTGMVSIPVCILISSRILKLIGSSVATVRRRPWILMATTVYFFARFSGILRTASSSISIFARSTYGTRSLAASACARRISEI